MSEATEPRVREPREREYPEWTSLLPAVLYITAIVLAFGYEVFSFNLTVDEEVTAVFTRAQRITGSIAEGRWTMATLTGLLPSTVIPVVSTAIGVGLSALCWWLLARRYLGLSPWKAAVACSVAGTFPVLAFLFSFSTIAWVIGIGSVLTLAFAAGISSTRLRDKILGVLAGAAAIGTYETFLIAIALIALALAARKGTFRSLIEGTIGAIAALVASRLIGFLYSVVFSIPVGNYTAGFLDIPGFLADPVGRSRLAVGDVFGTFLLTSDRFGLGAPTLALFSLVLLAAAGAATVIKRGAPGRPAVRVIALVGMVFVPFAVEAVAVVVVFRSMLYLPILLIALASIAFSHDWRLTIPLRKAAVVAFASLTVVAVLTNAIVVNRLFSTAATTYALDLQLAFQIGQEKDILLKGQESRELPIVVQGLHGWPDGAFTSVHETIGLSFFELNETRTARFLEDHGVLVHEATDAQHERVADTLKDMPVYPNEGWIAVENGVLILKFTEAS